MPSVRARRHGMNAATRQPVACRGSCITTTSYSGFKDWQLFGSIINVFNRMPPFNPAAGYGNVNYYYALSGATGMQFNIGARYTFK